MIYLDHNATTPVHPEVFEAMVPWFVDNFANPSSSHPGGKAARRAIDRARAQVASVLGAKPDEIVFTGSGTEASNLAIRGCDVGTGRIVITAIEHPATREPAHHCLRNGARLAVLGVDGAGAAVVPDALPEDTRLLSVMHANNETGVVQPVRALADLARRVGARVHVDAAQSVGKIPVSVDALGADLLSLAGHKLYGPKGIGALYVRAGTPLQPLLRGAGHERGLRPGTENVPAIVGLGAACALAEADLHALHSRWTRQRDALLEALGPARVQVNGGGSRLPNTLNVRFPGVSGNALLAACPEISASTGSACHAGAETPSAVLLAMGIPGEDALGSVRLSLGRSTTDDDITEAATALLRAFGNLWTAPGV